MQNKLQAEGGKQNLQKRCRDTQETLPAFRGGSLNITTSEN